MEINPGALILELYESSFQQRITVDFSLVPIHIHFKYFVNIQLFRKSSRHNHVSFALKRFAGRCYVMATRRAVALRYFQSLWWIGNWSNKQQLFFSTYDQKHLDGDLVERIQAESFRDESI